MSHHCHAEGCTARVPPRMFACRRHWRMVPPQLQRDLWNVYREGQEKDKQITTAYLLVQLRCRYQIALVENNQPALTKVARLLGLAMGMLEGQVRTLDEAQAWESPLSRGALIQAVDLIIAEVRTGKRDHDLCVMNSEKI